MSTCQNNINIDVGHQHHNFTNITLSPTPLGHQQHHEVTNTTMSPTQQCHQHHDVTNTTMSPTSPSRQHHDVTNITKSPTPRCHQHNSTVYITLSHLAHFSTQLLTYTATTRMSWSKAQIKKKKKFSLNIRPGREKNWPGREEYYHYPFQKKKSKNPDPQNWQLRWFNSRKKIWSN